MSENNFNWQEFLTQWNEEALSSKEVVKKLPPEVVKAGWLGRAGATEDEILAAEMRLGRTLPPSYREFLRVSDGWYLGGASVIERLLSSREIGWLNELRPDIVGNWTGFPDLDSGQLKGTLQISTQEVSGTAILLLNPAVVSDEGEWEGWFLAHWLPGFRKYPSFQAMMEDEFQSLLYAKLYQFEYDQKRPKIRRFEIINRIGTGVSLVLSVVAFSYEGWLVALGCLIVLLSWRTYWYTQIDKIKTNLQLNLNKRFAK